MSDNYYTWQIEISIHPTWVADGFELTAERLHEIIMKDIGYSYPHEIETKILKAPDPKAIRKEQGGE